MISAISQHLQTHTKKYCILATALLITAAICAIYASNEVIEPVRMRSGVGFTAVNNSSSPIASLHRVIHSVIPSRSAFCIECPLSSRFHLNS